jgi:hypothetical protein
VRAWWPSLTSAMPRGTCGDNEANALAGGDVVPRVRAGVAAVDLGVEPCGAT